MKKLNMRKNETKGLLFTFCGLDGSGKTTIIQRLLDDLQEEIDIVLTKQPTDFVRNSAIFRNYMDAPNHDAFDYRSLSLLAASDRVQHVHQQIEPAMLNGNVVFSDRYFYSCLANLRARGYKEDKWIYEVAKFVVKPDIAFFFDVSASTAIARVRKRPLEKDRYIDVALQKKLREEYLEICKKNNGVLIPTNISQEKSYLLVREAIERKIKHEYERKNLENA